MGTPMLVHSHNDSHHGRVVASLSGRDVIDCVPCRFYHIWPHPSTNDIDALYESQYYDSANLAFADQQQRDYCWGDCAYGDRLDIVEAILQKRGKLVDVGSGAGMFMTVASRRGWACTGIEPSIQATAYSRERGHNVIHLPFTKEVQEAVGRVDFVNMANVLEHVIDPVAMLLTARQILVPGGCLVVSVPNDFNPLQTACVRAAGLGPWWVAPDHHINYFTFPSMNLLLARSGFDVVDQHSSFPLEAFVIMGDNYIGNPSIGRACHEKRIRFDLALTQVEPAFRQSFYRALGSVGVGREIICYAQRTPD